METKITWSTDLESVPATARQKRWIKYVKENFLKNHHGEAHADKNEFKRFEIAKWAGRVIVLAVETGSKTDEGTAAAIFCRTRYLIVIGPRGGITVHDNSHGSKGKVVKGRLARVWIT
jgi:hypothetical protein